MSAVDRELFIAQPGDESRFDWAARLDRWLEPFGLYALHFHSSSGKPPVMPAHYYIMTGISPRGRPHAVVGHGHAIAWDPHPDRSGLSTVDGFIVFTRRFE